MQKQKSAIEHVVNLLDRLKAASLLAIIAFHLFEFTLHRQSDIFHEYEDSLLSLGWMLVVCLAVWCGTFIFLAFNLRDLLLIGLLLTAMAAYFIGYATSSWKLDAVLLLASVTLGKGAPFLLQMGRRNMESASNSKTGRQESGAGFFLIGLVVLLAFSSGWHLDMSNNFYHGPRWMGLWNNPNEYGMLMSVGVLLAVGLLADRRWKMESGRLLSVFLLIAAGMMLVGLVMSYSRGSWLGTAVGLLYLAKQRQNSGVRSQSVETVVRASIRWRWVLFPVLIAVATACYFWNNTSDDAPWYLKRADLSRPSAQHRVAAWKAGFEIMRDHPFGVGWNKAVETYGKDYSPPENGAAAITTNDYLMLGTQLGIPALVCFVAYVALQLGAGEKLPHFILNLSPHRGEGTARGASGTGDHARRTALDSTQITCRATVIAMLVEFWFDGGLFKLATASVFWILLELGANRGKIGHPASQKPATCV